MDFHVYCQKEVLSQEALTKELLDTIVDNLSYIFGEDMGTEENRNEWIQYNLRTEHPHWRMIAEGKNGRRRGFLIYTIENHQLTVCDIEIKKDSRRNPILLLGLFQTLFKTESHSFRTMRGYINKGNETSQKNFLKYATSIAELPRGYSFLIDEEATEKLKSRVLKWRAS